MDIKTKIVATIGPASLDIKTLGKMVDSGIDYIRINTSYGDEKQYDQILSNLYKVDKESKVKVILDIKDTKYLSYANTKGLNIIAVSFAESPQQIDSVREKISDAFIITKIESRVGVENFDQLLRVSDGIMVARGDLGEAVTLPEVPPLQKYFTQKTLEKSKLLITATEMLLSMVENPEPTRAEVSDVANAVFDNTSAVMLSEETAIGKYPVESVKYMRKIIEEAEEWNNSHTVNLT